MYISKIVCTLLRNLLSVQFEPTQRFNLLIGQNGSGKTSILEAIHFLSLARSFRSHQYKPIITHGCDQMIVNGVMDNGYVIGIEKNRTGKTRIKINGEWCKETISLASLVPLQLINPDAYKIVESGPQFRRKFLDWGVFHVKHQFFHWWQKGHHVLQQRNAALRQNYSKSQISLWDKELIEIAANLDELRSEYMSLLLPTFNDVISQLLNDEINLSYYCGWNKDESFETILHQAFIRDKHLGYTQFGPHRADLIFKVKDVPVSQVLSRGQQKLLIIALKIAQGMILQQTHQKGCIYLLDDLAAELDSERLSKVIGLLDELQAQVFITGVEEAVFQDLLKRDHSKMFHVKHGAVKE